MLRFSSPPRNAIRSHSITAPGSVPERLENPRQSRSMQRAAIDQLLQYGEIEMQSAHVVDHPDHYIKLPIGYQTFIQNKQVEQFIYQPTPAGMRLLVNEFSDSTGHPFHVIDQELTSGFDLKDRFGHAKAQIEAIPLSDNRPVAVIMMYGQRHAIPLLLNQKDGRKELVIFDSNSSRCTKHYYPIANMLPDWDVFLNRGTRQKDKQSCITDAFAIWSDALPIGDLSDQIRSKAEKTGFQSNSPTKRQPGERPIFIGATVEHDNFYLFHLPEALCVVAQRDQFIKKETQANLQKKFKLGNRTTTLEHELVKHQRIYHRSSNVPSQDDSPRNRFGMNSRLYSLSVEYKLRIDRALKDGGSESLIGLF